MSKSKVIFLVMVALLALACVSPVFFMPSSPTQAPGSIDTIIAETAVAAQTQTAFYLPPATATSTPTPIPTSTPSETPSPTPTIIFILPTATKIPTFTSVPDLTPTGKNYSCTVVSKSPVDGAIITHGLRFKARWTIVNTGKKIWLNNSIDVIYKSGAKIYDQAGYDLEKSVAPGKEITITVPMTAPATLGTYSTTWTLRVGKTTFCNMKISFEAK